MRTAFARKAAQEKRDRDHMKTLQQQLNAYQTNLQRAENKIEELKRELAAAMRDRENNNLAQTPVERVYLDIIKNHGRDPHKDKCNVPFLHWRSDLRIHRCPHGVTG
jgi:DNA repair exonuclease SbcCD ATPase subunit